MVETVHQPPWAGVRAAQCLLQLHPAEAAADLRRWVADPDRLGLAMVVWSSLHTLPADQAARLIDASLTGPNAAQVHRWLARSPQAWIQQRAALP